MIVTALAAGALLLHGLVELPLHYAYFLLPLGLFIGLTRPDPSGKQAASLRVPTGAKALLPTLSLAPALVLALLGSEYISATNVRPVVAVDKPTRHLMLIAELAPPDVLLLDQLKAYHTFAALELGPGTSKQNLAAARVAMQRAPFPVAIERYALLAGINGHAAEAEEALRKLCKFQTPRQCGRSDHAWGIWRQQWPMLPARTAQVPAP